MPKDVFKIVGSNPFPSPAEGGDEAVDPMVHLKSVFSLLIKGEQREENRASDHQFTRDLYNSPVKIEGRDYNGGKPEGREVIAFMNDNYKLGGENYRFSPIYQPQVKSLYEKDSEQYTFSYIGPVYTFMDPDDPMSVIGIDAQGNKIKVQPDGLDEMIKNRLLKPICEVSVRSVVDYNEKPPKCTFELSVSDAIPQLQYKGPNKIDHLPIGVTFIHNLGINNTIDDIARTLISKIDDQIKKTGSSEGLTKIKKDLNSILVLNDPSKKIKEMRTVLVDLKVATEKYQTTNLLKQFVNWVAKVFNKKKVYKASIYEMAQKTQVHFRSKHSAYPKLLEGGSHDIKDHRVLKGESYVQFEPRRGKEIKPEPWKAHITVNKDQLSKAWDLVYPILIAHGAEHFKVVNLSGMQKMMEQNKKELDEILKDPEVAAAKAKKGVTVDGLKEVIKVNQRVIEGAQITLYIPKGEEAKYNKMIAEIDNTLKDANLSQGTLPKTDRLLGNYSTVRFQGDDDHPEYTDSSKVAQMKPEHQYKPHDVEDPFKKVDVINKPKAVASSLSVFFSGGPHHGGTLLDEVRTIPPTVTPVVEPKKRDEDEPGSHKP